MIFSILEIGTVMPGRPLMVILNKMVFLNKKSVGVITPLLCIDIEDRKAGDR